MGIEKTSESGQLRRPHITNPQSAQTSEKSEEKSSTEETKDNAPNEAPNEATHEVPTEAPNNAVEDISAAEKSLLQKVIRKGLVESTHSVEVQRKDPNSPLFSVKNFEALDLYVLY